MDGVIDESGEYAGAFVCDRRQPRPCLKQLYDWAGGSPTAANLIAKAVKVWARRDASGNLYFAFRIKDSTQVGVVPGERVIVSGSRWQSRHGTQRRGRR